MRQQKILLKGMVCRRCLMTVEAELTNMGHTLVDISLGEVSFISKENFNGEALEKRLSSLGFSVLEDRKIKLTKDVKELVDEVYRGDFEFPERFRFAGLVENRLQKSYEYISDAFIASERKTIEQYIIEYRINKVKEYLMYSTFTLADIAFRLNFNSVAHLSYQFKQQTGLTPSFFKEVKRNKLEAEFSVN